MAARRERNSNEEMSNKENIGCAIFHIIVPLVAWGLFSLYQHFFPKTDEQLAELKDPNRKVYFNKFLKEKYHPGLEDRIARLDTLSKNLNEILYFIDYQKINLKLQEKNLKELLEQNKELEPIVKAKSDLVDAIFETQEKRNAKDKKKDQIFGFIFGVISSIAASIIIHFYNRLFKKKKITSPNENITGTDADNT